MASTTDIEKQEEIQPASVQFDLPPSDAEIEPMNSSQDSEVQKYGSIYDRVDSSSINELESRYIVEQGYFVAVYRILILEALVVYVGQMVQKPTWPAQWTIPVLHASTNKIYLSAFCMSAVLFIFLLLLKRFEVVNMIVFVLFSVSVGMFFSCLSNVYPKILVYLLTTSQFLMILFAMKAWASWLCYLTGFHYRNLHPGQVMVRGNKPWYYWMIPWLSWILPSICFVIFIGFDMYVQLQTLLLSSADYHEYYIKVMEYIAGILSALLLFGYTVFDMRLILRHMWHSSIEAAISLHIDLFRILFCVSPQ